MQLLGGQIDVPDDLPPLSAATEVAAYRIALEALANASRHAHAASYRLTVSADNDLRLEVEDDGVGLPADYTSGIALASIKSRAAELGGSLVIEPRTPRGTRVLAILPLGT